MSPEILAQKFMAGCVGVVSSFAGPDLPDGWLRGRKQALSRSVYRALFDVIGTTYGAGDGLTTFNLPELEDDRAIFTGVFLGGAPLQGSAFHHSSPRLMQ